MSNFKNIFVVDFIREIINLLHFESEVISYNYNNTSKILQLEVRRYDTKGREIIVSKNDTILLQADGYDYSAVITEVLYNFDTINLTCKDVEIFIVNPQNFIIKTLSPYYLHGTPLVISNILKEKDATKKYSFQKYPLIALYEPFMSVINRDMEDVFYSRQDITLVFADKIDFDKQSNNPDSQYNDVIEKLYDNFITLFFDTLDKHRLIYSPIKEYNQEIITNYGLRKKYGHGGNIFPDWLAAVEISIDLSLKKDYICNT